MKKSLFLYLFIIAVLFNVFTYMYYSKALSFEQGTLKTKTKMYKDSITTLKDRVAEASYFTLENNQNAQDYFENKTTGEFIAPEKLIPFLKANLEAENDNPEGNKYVGFDKMDGRKFIINKIKVLNHRWILADFNNGEMWGEVIIKYFLNADGSVSFETAETVIYPNR